MSGFTADMVLSKVAERKSSDENGPYTGRLVTVDAVHSQVHKGQHFFITASTANASATDILGIVLTTPATKRVHFVDEFGGSAAVIHTLVENPTVANTSKVALVEFNNDRESTKAAGVVAVTISDTDVSGGTTLQKHVLGGGLQGRTGGNLTARAELNLKQSEDYYISIASDGANNDISYLGLWYEIDS